MNLPTTSYKLSATNSRISATAALFVLLVATPGTVAYCQKSPLDASPAPAASKPAAKSSLPTEALERAREAEKHLAANEPDKAIAILQDLDRKHPNQPAISLRLAEVHDTLNRYGFALVYYRRYIKLAGDRARDTAAARVQTLELMAGIDDDAAAAAKTLGEQTIPVATPAPKVERMLAAARKDGSLVPIRNEKDWKNIRSLTAKPAEESPVPTPTHTPIVIPDSLTATPSPSPVAVRSTAVASSAPGDAMNVSAPEPSVTSANSTANVASVAATPRVTVSEKATPRKPDEDALLARAFISADSPASITLEEASTPRSGLAGSEVAAIPAEATPTPSPAQTRKTPTLRQTTVPSLGEAVAFTKATPISASPRAANFFYITKSNSSYAQVVMINDLPQAIVTLSVVPQDDRSALSAILMPGESKTLYVPPGTYNVTANASSNDYSPVTLMNTQFQYKFEKAKQYTRRVTQDTLQRVN